MPVTEPPEMTEFGRETRYESLLAQNKFSQQSPQKGHKRFFRKIAAWFGLASAILVGVSVVSYRSTAELIKNSQQVVHTQNILEELENVLSHMKDAETGQRGYIITVILTDNGKNLMDNIRGSIGEMENEENRLLTQRSQEAEASARKAIFTLSSGVFLTFLILVAVYYLIYREISERKRIEQVLRESEERFQIFMDNSPVVAFIIDKPKREHSLAQTSVSDKSTIVMDNMALIQEFIQNFVQGQAILLSNPNLRAEPVGDTIQLIAKTEGVIVKAKLTEKPRSALVNRNSRYWELIHQAMFANSFFPIRHKQQEGVYRYEHRPMPENYQMHCTNALELWEVWSEHMNRDYYPRSMNIIMLREGTWSQIKDISCGYGKNLYIKTINDKVAIDRADILIWGQKIEEVSPASL